MQEGMQAAFGLLDWLGVDTRFIRVSGYRGRVDSRLQNLSILLNSIVSVSSVMTQVSFQCFVCSAQFPTHEALRKYTWYYQVRRESSLLGAC